MTRSEAQCYQTLGLTTTASMDDVKRAYRSIARKLHPDRFPGKEEQFKEITAAYNVIVDRHGRGQTRGGVRGQSDDGSRSPRGQKRSHRGPAGKQWGAWKPKGAPGRGAAGQNTAGRGAGSAGDKARPKGESTASGSTWERHRTEERWRRARAKAAKGQGSTSRQTRENAQKTQSRRDSTERRRETVRGQGPQNRNTVSGSRQSAESNRGHSKRNSSSTASNGPREKAPFRAKRHKRASQEPQGRPQSRRYAEEPDFWSEGNLGAEKKSTESAPPDDFNAAWRAWCESAERYHAENGEPIPHTERGPILEPRRDETTPGTGKKLVDWVRRGLRRVRGAGPELEGDDVVLRLAVSVDQLFHGGELRIAALRPVACPSCQGTGDASCVCDGSGRIRIRDEVPVTLPPGARNGIKLRVEGKGGDGLEGADNGDLILHLDPPELPGFRREGLNLQGTMYVSQRMARVGGTIQLELPRGAVSVNVPPQSRSGDRFRLRGQGVPVWGGGELGDMVLSVVVR